MLNELYNVGVSIIAAVLAASVFVARCVAQERAARVEVRSRRRGG